MSDTYDSNSGLYVVNGEPKLILDLNDYKRLHPGIEVKPLDFDKLEEDTNKLFNGLNKELGWLAREIVIKSYSELGEKLEKIK